MYKSMNIKTASRMSDVIKVTIWFFNFCNHYQERIEVA